jgi:O-antigen/teichoic acid export membrane protein
MSPPSYLVNVVWQAASRVLSVAANIAIFVLVARRLGADALGRFSWVMTLVGVFTVLAEFGTTPLLARELVRTEARSRYWGAFLAARAVLAAAVLLPMAALAVAVGEPDRTYIAIVLAAMPFAAARFFDPVFQVCDRPFLGFVPSLVYAATYGALGAVAVETSPSLTPLLVAFGLSNLAYVALAAALSRRVLRPARPRRREWRAVLAAAAPIGVSSAFSIVNTRADVFLLSHLRADAEVGIYSAAYRFLDLAAVAGVLLVGPVIPVFSSLFTARRHELKDRYGRILETLGVVLLPVAVLTPLVSADVVALVYGRGFLGASSVLNVLAWVALLTYLSLLGSALCVAAGVVRQGYWTTALAAAVNVALNLVLIPRFGFMGSAWATLASEILLVCVCYAYLTRTFGWLFRPAPWARILAANAALAGACAAFASAPYRYAAFAGFLALYAAFVAKGIFGGGLVTYLRSGAPKTVRAAT